MVKYYKTKVSIHLKESDFLDYNDAMYLNNDINKNFFHMRLIEVLKKCAFTLEKKLVSVSAGDIILINSDQPLVIEPVNGIVNFRVFSFKLTAPTPINMVIVGDNPGIHDLMNDTTKNNPWVVYRHLTKDIKHDYCDLIETIENLPVEQYLSFQRQMLVGLLFTELLRNHKEAISVPNSNFPGTDIHHAGRDTQTGVIFNYLVMHIQGATLTNTAEYFGYQPNYFSRLCRQLFSQSFTEKLTVIRQEMSERMLALTNKSIEEISFELGYKNTSSFYAVFRRNTGLTPQSFRLKKQNSFK